MQRDLAKGWLLGLGVLLICGSVSSQDDRFWGDSSSVFHYSRHYWGMQITSALNPIIPAAQFQYQNRFSPNQAMKLELGYLFSPYFRSDERSMGTRIELAYHWYPDEYCFNGIALGGRYAWHQSQDVRVENFSSTIVDFETVDEVRFRSRLGGIWYVMGGQFLHSERTYSQIEFLLGLIVYERMPTENLRGRRVHVGDDFLDFIQPRLFRARVLPSIRIYYSFGIKSPEAPEKF